MTQSGHKLFSTNVTNPTFDLDAMWRGLIAIVSGVYGQEAHHSRSLIHHFCFHSTDLRAANGEGLPDRLFVGHAIEVSGVWKFYTLFELIQG